MKRLLLVFVCILLIPFTASIQPAPFTAYAGHTNLGGGYCDGPPCVHYPGTNSMTPGGKSAKEFAPEMTPDALIVALALIAWLRLRSA